MTYNNQVIASAAIPWIPATSNDHEIQVTISQSPIDVIDEDGFALFMSALFMNRNATLRLIGRASCAVDSAMGEVFLSHVAVDQLLIVQGTPSLLRILHSLTRLLYSGLEDFKLAPLNITAADVVGGGKEYGIYLLAVYSNIHDISALAISIWI